MPQIYFSKLPINVARSAFRDAISKYLLQNSTGDPSDGPGQQFTVHLPIADKPTAEHKHDGYGSLEFDDDATMMGFWAKLKTEPIMFKSETVLFSREPPSPSILPTIHELSIQTRPESTAQITRPSSVADSHISTASTAKRMNLNRAKYRPVQPERTGPRPENPRYERKHQHRLSVLGQRARLERIEFGVLRGRNFSTEYSRELLEYGGDLSFEDDEKSLRVIMGGTHKDPEIPSIKISIQTINKVALGDDFGRPYMFLELIQNPHFELGNASRETTGNSKNDARRSRTRHSALDPKHRRVAPYTSRWLKMTFYSDSFIPDYDICLLAGLPLPDMNPDLTFNKYEKYSLRNIEILEKWLQGGSLPWEVAFQCEALFRNGTLVPQELLLLRPRIERLVQESTLRACDALTSFRNEMEGAGAPKKLVEFEDQAIVSIFEKHIQETEKKTPMGRLRDGSTRSNFDCHHVKITPTAIFLTGPLAEQSNRVIRRYPGFESHFIRVSFTDEGDSRTRFDFEVDTNAFSEARVGRFLKTGLQIGDRHYALLGYSQSGFRDHACFFSSDFVFGGMAITPESVRTSLGDFKKVIRCPARYGARMSQAFSSTDPSITIPQSAIKHIPDIITPK
ncbi:hypothetical protein FRC12_012967, partial [Ceratobasidium sp. 428]